MTELNVFCAGVAGKMARRVADAFAAERPDVQVNLQIGGSTAGVNKLLGGEVFDVLILADNSDIEKRLMPEYADGYFIWGGNAMTVIGCDITPDNWAERLCDPASVITHRNPYDDPGGYRAVMALKLADQVEPGLSERIFANPGYKGLDRAQYVRPAAKPGEKPQFKGPQPPEPGHYDISYRSMPVALGFPYVDLPAQMNLGDPAYEDLYRTVSFAVDGADGPEEVRGTTIYHAVCIPKGAPHVDEARVFVAEFLKTDFVGRGFTPVRRAVGNWPLTCENEDE